MHKKKQQIRKHKESFFQKEMINKQGQPQELGQRPFRCVLTASAKFCSSKDKYSTAYQKA